MHRRRLLGLSGTLIAGAMSGCMSSSARQKPLGEQAEPGAVPDVDDEALAALAGSANGLAMDLHAQLVAENPDANVLASPASLTTCLAMAYAGARGETRTQMQETLHYSIGEDRLHEAFNALQRTLNARGDDFTRSDVPEGFDSDDDPVPFQLNLVNAVWGQEEYPFREAYLQTLENHYGSGLREVDFSTDPAAARSVINDWVAEQTVDRIPELLPEGSLDTLTRLVLTNALYFKANWRYPFETDATREEPFTALDGSASTVSMMAQTETVPYAEVDGSKVVDLPYLGGAVSMLLVLPPTGEFEAYEQSLDRVELSRLSEELSVRKIDLSIPRFTFESSLTLESALEALGMPLAFDRTRADFTGIADEQLYVDQVYQDTFIGVDENGTEAAAATGAVINAVSAPGAEFVADRPFLFAIRDRPTGTILFLGRVVDAAAAQD